jgi:hypothetical protein
MFPFSEELLEYSAAVEEGEKEKEEESMWLSHPPPLSTMILCTGTLLRT